MANKTVIDYQQMTQIASKFGDLSSTVTSVISAVQNQTDGIQAQWTGSGAGAFQADVGQQLIPALQRLQAALSSAQEISNQIIKIYQQAEGGASGQIIHNLRNFNPSTGTIKGSGFQSTVRPTSTGPAAMRGATSPNAGSAGTPSGSPASGTGSVSGGAAAGNVPMPTGNHPGAGPTGNFNQQSGGTGAPSPSGNSQGNPPTGQEVGGGVTNAAHHNRRN